MSFEKNFLSDDNEQKQGKLPVALYPNNMVQDKNGKISYYAMTIIRGVCKNEDIANDMLAAGLNDELPEKL